MRKRIDHWCSVVQKNPNPRPTGIFLSPLNTNEAFVLSHIPVPARGKDKKQTAARQPHAGCKSIHDVIVMLKFCHHVASQRILDFLEVFFHIFQMRYLVVSKKKNPLFVRGWNRKSCSSQSPFDITRQAS